MEQAVPGQGSRDLDDGHRPDILDLSATMIRHAFGSPDIVLASPPCETFSTMSMGRNWTKAGEPKTDKAALAEKLILHMVELIEELEPAFFVIENPTGRLRSLDLLPYTDMRPVWYCRLGEPVAKPTTLWGGFPRSLRLPAVCHNQRESHANDCRCRDHIGARRGSQSGTQGIGRGKADAATRAKIPYGLGLTVCLAAEADL
jgi:hypothetical protein